MFERSIQIVAKRLAEEVKAGKNHALYRLDRSSNQGAEITKVTLASNNLPNILLLQKKVVTLQKIKIVSIMTAIEIQSSLAKTIYEINDISILEQVKNAIQRIMSIKSKTTTTTNKFELTPFVKKMCTGHGLDDKIDDKQILENALMKKMFMNSITPYDVCAMQTRASLEIRKGKESFPHWTWQRYSFYTSK